MVDRIRSLNAKDLFKGLAVTNVHSVKARSRMNLLSLPHREVVHYNNVMTLFHQGVYNMRCDKSRSSCNQYLHEISF
jgi:hypothetical protein